MIDLRPLLDNGPLYVHCRNRQESEEFWEGVKDQFHRRSWDDDIIRTVLGRVDYKYGGDVVFQIFIDNGNLRTNWCDLYYYVERERYITEYSSLAHEPAVVDPIELEPFEPCHLFS